MILFQIYVISIPIWFLIIYCVVQIFGPDIIDNGWLDGETSYYTGPSYGLPILIASTPIFRLLVVSGLIYMSNITREEYETIKNKKEDDE